MVQLHENCLPTVTSDGTTPIAYIHLSYVYVSNYSSTINIRIGPKQSCGFEPRVVRWVYVAPEMNQTPLAVLASGLPIPASGLASSTHLSCAGQLRALLV